jgi:hypothetical protein
VITLPLHFRNVVGIYNVPRSGSNFLAACLHCHPQVFAVSERQLNWQTPLLANWKRRSILKKHGRQDKRMRDVTHVVFNKVQRSPHWKPARRFRPGTRFLFHVRNPVRIHLSRDAYRGKFDPTRSEWKASLENFNRLLAEMRSVLDAYDSLRSRYASLLISHEYFCCHHEAARSEVFDFLGLPTAVARDIRSFFRVCGECGKDLQVCRIDGTNWLMCRSCGAVVRGYGNFNPLREIDENDIRNRDYVSFPQYDELMLRVESTLGSAMADYYRLGEYDENIRLTTPVSVHRPDAFHVENQGDRHIFRHERLVVDHAWSAEK